MLSGWHYCCSAGAADDATAKRDKTKALRAEREKKAAEQVLQLLQC